MGVWRILAVVVLALALLAGFGLRRNPPAPGVAFEVFFASTAVAESSGLARSGHDATRFWTVNDSGNTPVLYALGLDGQIQAALPVADALNVDWEDLAAFRMDAQPWLLIADTGDNRALRPHVALYLVAEPAVLDGVDSLPLRRVLRLRYPDGPRDVEAVAVDEAAGQVYLLSKRDPLPRLYRLPLTVPGPADAIHQAEALGEIRIPRAESGTPWERNSYNWVTALDFDPAGRRAGVMTLSHLYLYPRRDGEDWAAALRRAPAAVIPLPGYTQMEAGSFSADGRSWYLTSENLPVPLARLDLPAQPAD
ncbi:MAG: hypothetical protein ACLGHI_06500 [Gammaproteobacteria bacterium]